MNNNDIEYLKRLSVDVKHVGHNVYNLRCMICGDSQRSQGKKRMYVFPSKDLSTHLVKCHNCGYSSNFRNFLKQVNESLYQDYRRHSFSTRKESSFDDINPASYKREALGQQKETIDVFKTKYNLKYISELSVYHPARVYYTSRCLPTCYLDYFMYTDNFYYLDSFCDYKDQQEDKKDYKDARIIIPFCDTQGIVQTLQGRSIDPNNKIRYMTVKRNKEAIKIFGLDRLSKDHKVYVLEGPIDSLFITNAIATADANLLQYKNGDVYIPDNQYKNKDIYRVAKSIIVDAKKEIVIFPKWFAYKDINEFVIQEKLSQTQLMEYIQSRTFSGQKALLELSIGASSI